MAFGQQSGPPAGANQLQELLTLLQDAGHAGFRDARGPMGFTQRQGAGKFTREEAAAFIGRLQDPAADPATPAATPAGTTPAPPSPVLERALRGMPADGLAAELRRRGWLVLEP